MEIKQKVVNYYVAEDGTEFDDEKKCIEYENEIERIKSNIRFYELSYEYGDNGFMQKAIEIAVYSESQYLCENIIQEWAIRERNMNFIVKTCTNGKEETLRKGFNLISKNSDSCFFNYKIGDKVGADYSPSVIEKVFLSPISIKGFPEPFDYIEKWGLSN